MALSSYTKRNNTLKSILLSLTPVTLNLYINRGLTATVLYDLRTFDSCCTIPLIIVVHQKPQAYVRRYIYIQI